MVMKCFRSSVNVAKTQSFPGADIGSDHDLVMTMIGMCLKSLPSANKHVFALILKS